VRTNQEAEAVDLVKARPWRLLVLDHVLGTSFTIAYGTANTAMRNTMSWFLLGLDAGGPDIGGPCTTTIGQTFCFVSPTDGTKAFQKLTVGSKIGQPEKNFGREEKPAVIENFRGKEDLVSLDKTGFQVYC